MEPEYVALVFILIVFVYAIKKIKKLDFDQPQMIKRIFLTSVIAYALTQVLGFIHPFISSLYQTKGYLEIKETYYAYLKEHYALKNFAIEMPSWILKYLIIVFLILKEIKQATKSQV